MNFREYKEKLRGLRKQAGDDWDTEELWTWLVNDEGMLEELERLVGAQGWRAAPALREWAEGLGIPGIDVDNVDWDTIISDTEESLNEGIEFDMNEMTKPPPPTPQEQYAHLPPDQNPTQWQAGDVIEDHQGNRAHVRGPLGDYALPMNHIAPDKYYHGEDFSLHPSALVNTYGYRRVDNKPLDYNWLADPSLDQPGDTYPPPPPEDPDTGQSDLKLPEHWGGLPMNNCALCGNDMGNGMCGMDKDTKKAICMDCWRQQHPESVPPHPNLGIEIPGIGSPLNNMEQQNDPRWSHQRQADDYNAYDWGEGYCPSCHEPMHFQQGQWVCSGCGETYPSDWWNQTVEAEPQNFAHPDPWMDNEPGGTTFPSKWAGMDDPTPDPAFDQERQQMPEQKSQDQQNIVDAVKSIEPQMREFMRTRGINEPDWAPLEHVIPPSHLGDWMWMGYGDNGQREYKHYRTRRYLNLLPRDEIDESTMSHTNRHLYNRPYVPRLRFHQPGGQPSAYRPVDMNYALSHAYDSIDQLGGTHPYPQGYPSTEWEGMEVPPWERPPYQQQEPGPSDIDPYRDQR